MIEDKIPDLYKRPAYHPSAYVYAWKRTNLEKLFDELMKSNIAILKGEVWLVEGGKVVSIIPLQSGQMKVFHWENRIGVGEEWADYVERSIKESGHLIELWNLEKTVRVDVSHKIWYHFEFGEEVDS